MVHRQLLVTLALGLLTACGDAGSGTVSIALQLDSVSCGAAADRIELGCGGILWVQVVRADGSELERACVDMGPSALDFSAIAPLLEQGLQLASLPANEPIRIRLAILTGELSTCPSSADAFASLVSGDTGLVELGQEDVIRLGLTCSASAVPDPMEPNEDDPCQSCDQQLDQCLSLAGVSSCDQINETCNGTCADGQDNCQNCSALSMRCEDGPAPTLTCEGTMSDCLELCQPQPEGCFEECEQVQSLCEAIVGEIDACLQSSNDCTATCGELNCLRIK